MHNHACSKTIKIWLKLRHLLNPLGKCIGEPGRFYANEGNMACFSFYPIYFFYWVQVIVLINNFKWKHFINCIEALVLLKKYYVLGPSCVIQHMPCDREICSIFSSEYFVWFKSPLPYGLVSAFLPSLTPYFISSFGFL